MSSATSATAAAAAAAIPISFLSIKRPSFLFPSQFSPRLISSGRRLVSAASPAAEKDKKRVLIVNTDSGGHAVIGFYLAGQLLADGHNVTILTAGDENSGKMKKPPFTRFSELVGAGGRTVWGDPVEVGEVVGEVGFDVVLDNNGKDLEAVK